ncbi:uncharacterized protein [Littorina saxatilis]
MAFAVRSFNKDHGLLLIFVTSLLVVICDVTATADTEDNALHNGRKEKSTVDLGDAVDAIFHLQYNETTSFSDKHSATLLGLFPTEVRVSVNSEPTIAAVRNDNVVPDLSSLATLLTLNALVEATVRGQLKKLAASNLVQALEALGSFRSPLFDEKSALLTFWPTYTSGKSEDWNTTSDNAVKGGRGLIPLVILNKAVADCKNKCPLGKATLNKIKNNRLCLEVYNQSLSDYAEAHSLPPDVTSSFANLALGALLASGGDHFSSVFDVWKNSNANFSRLIQHADTFAYRPLSTNSSANVIDSRSYYIIEKFLSQRDSGELEKDAFVTNWISQKTVDGRLKYGKMVLPVYNTVDLFATATFLHAVTTAILTNLTGSSDMIETLVKSNLDLMAWIVSNGNHKLDLLMTSHPSVVQFMWMLSRTMFELENAKMRNATTFKPLEQFYSKWNTTVRLHVTETILTLVQDGGLDSAGNGLAYVDDIIGIGDVNDKGKVEASGGDRQFATATAANILLSAWTVYTTEHRLIFLQDTPNDVALAARRLVNYVTSRSTSGKNSRTNVIRATLHKHCE